MEASKRFLGIAQQPTCGSVWALRASSLLCSKPGSWERFLALVAPSVLLSAGWNDAQEQQFSPAINRVCVCDVRGRRADSSVACQAGMWGWGWGRSCCQNTSSENYQQDWYSKGRQAEPSLHHPHSKLNWKHWTSRLSCWPAFSLPGSTPKQELTVTIFSCRYLLRYRGWGKSILVLKTDLKLLSLLVLNFPQQISEPTWATA